LAIWGWHDSFLAWTFPERAGAGGRPENPPCGSGMGLHQVPDDYDSVVKEQTSLSDAFPLTQGKASLVREGRAAPRAVDAASPGL
jgi:hypothetical protein